MKTAIFCGSLALIFIVPANAQQTSRTPSQIAVGVDNDVGVLAQFADQCIAAQQSLKKQLDDAQARIKELEDKYEPKKPDEPKP